MSKLISVRLEIWKPKLQAAGLTLLALLTNQGPGIRMPTVKTKKSQLSYGMLILESITH